MNKSYNKSKQFFPVDNVLCRTGAIAFPDYNYFHEHELHIKYDSKLISAILKFRKVCNIDIVETSNKKPAGHRNRIQSALTNKTEYHVTRISEKVDFPQVGFGTYIWMKVILLKLLESGRKLEMWRKPFKSPLLPESFFPYILMKWNVYLLAFQLQ